jgi:predicted metalloprotease with PDZ domain
VRGVTHYLVDIGEGGIWDGAKTVADVQKIVETAAAFWGGVPYDKYVFFNLIVQATGGSSTRTPVRSWRTAGTFARGAATPRGSTS